MGPKFAKGDNVRILGTSKIGTVNDVIEHSGGYSYRVTADGKAKNYQEKYLERHVDEEAEIIEALETQKFGLIDDFHLFQTWYRLKRPVEGNFYSYLGSRTIFNAFQFKPLAKFISASSDERLFIADEVGVGKTIETGIILTELIARGRITRRSPVLVVCPNSLGPKWVKEMRERFNLPFRLHNGPSLRNALQSVKDGGILPEDSLWSIVSLELARMESHTMLLDLIKAQREAPVWSLVVIDEAHHLRNSETESNYLGFLLSDMTEMMLMLSATPLNLRDQDLFNQMTILNPALFPDQNTFNALLSPVKSINRCRRLLAQNNTVVFGEILNELERLMAGTLGKAIAKHPRVSELKLRLQKGGSMASDEIVGYGRILTSLSPLNNSFTRTLKREAFGHRVTREVLKVPVKLSDEEMAFHQDVVQAVQDAYLEGGGDPRALGFITNMPRRMLTSCIPAMKLYLEWCLERDQLIVVDDSVFLDGDDDSESETRPLSPEMRAEFARLRDRAVRLKSLDSKYQQFITVIRQLTANMDNKRIIVFSFFVRTLKYLQDRLEREGYRVGLIYGNVPVEGDGQREGRFDIMGRFERGEIDILLSSEVGGEGLDFQYCQAIVNYDLPYNPMRVEQRIGRIDRFGQPADKVFVASMFLAGTVDEDIYHALFERIRLVEDSIGELEPIIGSQLLDIQKSILSGELSHEQIEARVKEVEAAVAQARLEMEAFENSRAELLGEDLFTSYFQNMGQENDFVKPLDAARLTSICLTNWEGCSYEPAAAERGTVRLSPAIANAVEEYTRKPGLEAGIVELKPLFKSGKNLRVIFDGSQADNYRDYNFLPPCGYWTRFLLSRIEDRGNLPRVFRLGMPVTGGLNPGYFLVPLYESVFHGLRDQIDMNAVPVDLQTGQVVECDYRVLSREIFHHAVSDSWPVDTEQDYDHLIELAAEALDFQLEERAEKVRDENQYRIDARIESLRKGSEIRVARHRQAMEDHQQRAQTAGSKPSPDFLRMKDAQIKLDISRTQSTTDSLSKESPITPACNLIGIVLLQVESQ